MNLYDRPLGQETRWFSPENPDGERGKGGLENRGSKGRPFVSLPAGQAVTLMDYRGSGIIGRIWATINDRSPEMLRGLRIDMYWENQSVPAVSVPFGDFFGIGLGRRTPFGNALFSDPEGRSFNCFIPMPFRESARIIVTNESGKDLSYLFFDVDALVNVEHAAGVLYFHASWRRENPNELGRDFAILPFLEGTGRFLGCSLGVIADPRYEGSWWGEGEVKMKLDGEGSPTLCGTGTEDYIGTAWGQGQYAHRTQGCPIADDERGQYSFYRFHIDDPVYFYKGIEVTIQTIGGSSKANVLSFVEKGIPLIPTSLDTAQINTFTPLMTLPQPVDLKSIEPAEGWCNFWRQDDWSAVAYLYLDNPAGMTSPLADIESRVAGLKPIVDATKTQS